jgi:pimeloyl-ACP methyl ester carboxylesterase
MKPATPLQTERDWYLDVPLGSLYIEEIGPIDSPAIIFLHSGGAGYPTNEWDPQLRKLCSAENGECQYRLIRYERPGYGQSGERQHGFPENFFEDDLQDLARLISILKLKLKPIIIGTSDGGTIAMMYCGMFSDAVKMLILEGAHAYVENQLVKKLREMKFLFNERWGSEPGLREDLKRFTTRQWFAAFESFESSDWNILDLVGQIKCPTLVIQGEEDGFVLDQHAYKIAETVSGYSRTMILPEAGHLCHRTHPDMYYSEVIDFIRTHE